ncbi:hypothetical protein PG988_007891 [Apiospora saccharicola]
MQATLPSKQLMRHLQDFLEERLPVSLDSAYQLCYRQRVIAQGASHLNQSFPSPRLFGKNSSVSILETACFKLSNGFDDVDHEHSTYRLLEWIGNIADTALLKAFFRLENSAVVALWWDLIIRPTPISQQYKTLLEVGLAVREAEWFRYEFDTEFFNMSLVDEQNDRAARIMDTWTTTTLLRGFYSGEIQISSHKGIREFAEPFGFGHVFLLQTRLHVGICIVCWLLQAGASGDPYFRWVPSMRPLLPDWSTRSLPLFTRKRMQFLSGLRRASASSRERGEWLEIVVKVWFICSAASQGMESLSEQTHLLFKHVSPARDFALQMTLSEAIGMEDSKIVRTLLNFGVDPNATLLPIYEVTDNNTCLDPLPRASGLHNSGLVAMLIEYGADLIRLRPLALHLAVANVETLTKKGAAKFWSTITLLLLPHEHTSSWTDGNTKAPLEIDCGTLHLVMRALGRLEAVHQITPPQYHAVLTRLIPTDTVRRAIRASCSLSAIESLKSYGLELDPRSRDQGCNLLHDALLARSVDRYSIVKLLLDRGACHSVGVGQDSGLSLEATLRSTATPDPNKSSTSSISEWRAEQKESLRLFEEFRRMGAQVPSNVQCLLSLMLAHRSPISTFKEIAEARSGRGHLGNEYANLVVYSLALGRTRPAEWLLDMGVDVNMGRYRKRSALWTACSKKLPESFIRLLIEKGAKVEPPATPGRTPLQIAASKGSMAVASILLCHEALINTECSTLSGEPLRMTALDWAAAMGRLDMVRFLMDCGGSERLQRVDRLRRRVLACTRSSWCSQLLRAQYKVSVSSGDVIIEKQFP